jgi:hypothetical protein
MGYTGGGLGKNGQGIAITITPEMKSPRTSLGYDVVVSSLPLPGLATPRQVLFVAGGFQTGLQEEKPTTDCVEHIYELVVPNMP